MSTQTIIQNTFDTILYKIDDFYICQGTKYINQKDYDLGDGININSFLVIEWLDKIVSSGICTDISDDKIIEQLNLILNNEL